MKLIIPSQLWEGDQKELSPSHKRSQVEATHIFINILSMQWLLLQHAFYEKKIYLCSAVNIVKLLFLKL